MNTIVVRLNVNLWKAYISCSTFASCTQLLDKSSARKQGKIFNKLLGNRVTGSKKRWIENIEPSLQNTQSLSSPSNFTKPSKNDQSTKRRTTILNKLFMAHISDLLATGEASHLVVGKGLQITRVKITQNFQICNVYWMAKSDVHGFQLEEQLKKCAGILRHELSQLRLMGEVPRIHFVKDKTHSNLAEVETVLQTCDFGDNHIEVDPSLQIKVDLYGYQPEIISNETKEGEERPIPEMRHDVFGLDHRAIMQRILTKMKKSEQAWQQHEQGNKSTEEPKISAEEKMEQMRKRLEETEKDEKFKNFLATLSESNRKRERRFRRADDGVYRRIGNDENDPLEDGDYIDEDYNEKK